MNISREVQAAFDDAIDRCVIGPRKPLPEPTHYSMFNPSPAMIRMFKAAIEEHRLMFDEHMADWELTALHAAFNDTGPNRAQRRARSRG